MIDCSENTLSEHVVLSNELSGYIWKYFLDMRKIIGNLSHWILKIRITIK